MFANVQDFWTTFSAEFSIFRPISREKAGFSKLYQMLLRFLRNSHKFRYFDWNDITNLYDNIIQFTSSLISWEHVSKFRRSLTQLCGKDGQKTAPFRVCVIQYGHRLALLLQSIFSSPLLLVETYGSLLQIWKVVKYKRVLRLTTSMPIRDSFRIMKNTYHHVMRDSCRKRTMRKN